MPADHLACNTKVWKKLKKHEQGAMLAAIEIAGRTITSLVERKNAEAVKALNEMGVTLHDWSRDCLLYTSPSPRDPKTSRMPSSA